MWTRKSWLSPRSTSSAAGAALLPAPLLPEATKFRASRPNTSASTKPMTATCRMVRLGLCPPPFEGGRRRRVWLVQDKDGDLVVCSGFRMQIYTVYGAHCRYRTDTVNDCVKHEARARRSCPSRNQTVSPSNQHQMAALRYQCSVHAPQTVYRSPLVRVGLV